jgi:endonuclease/exonuclease/phosphatase (EEP) superfamily protein YafD
MRRINLKFAAVLVLVLLLSAAGLWGLYVFQSERIAQSLIWQARKNRDEGQAEAAIKLAAQYLQFRPDDAAVTAELAEWQRERASGRKQLAGVANLYEKVLRLKCI